MNRFSCASLVSCLLLGVSGCADDRPFYQRMAEVEQRNADARRHNACISLGSKIHTEAVQGNEAYNRSDNQAYYAALSRAKPLCDNYYGHSLGPAYGTMTQACPWLLDDKLSTKQIQNQKEFCDIALRVKLK